MTEFSKHSILSFNEHYYLVLSITSTTYKLLSLFKGPTRSRRMDKRLIDKNFKLVSDLYVIKEI